MRFIRLKSLYFKICLSFFGILVLCLVLIAGLFLFSVGRHFKGPYKEYAATQVHIIRDLVQEKIKGRSSEALQHNQELKDLLDRLGATPGAAVWITGKGGAVLLHSAGDQDATSYLPPSERRMYHFAGAKVYHGGGIGRDFYAAIPVELPQGGRGALHASIRLNLSHDPKMVFFIGLAVIDIIIALLIIPVSRLITRPVRALRRSALMVADGELSHRAELKSKDEIGELGRAFDYMAENLEEKIKAGKELTANVSHELRSPLARIRLAEELIGRKLQLGRKDEAKRHLGEIREEVEHMDGLIGRMLQFSKLDLAQEPLEMGPLDLAQVKSALMERAASSFTAKEIEVIDEMPLLLLSGDREVLSVALGNLIDNALKYTPAGGRVKLQAESGDGNVSVRITNTAETLTAQELENIFDPFYRPKSAEASGSGLGLALVKRIAEKHGGRVAARNTQDGFQVEMILPVG